MSADGAMRQVQALGDLLVGQAARRQLRHALAEG